MLGGFAVNHPCYPDTTLVDRKPRCAKTCAMSQEATIQTAFRLPATLLERLDRHAERLRVVHPGMTVTRADVVRMLLTRALDELEVRASSGRSAVRRKK